MKKLLLITIAAFALTACDTTELEVINQEVKAAKDNKQDPNFRIFNDRIQNGKK